MSTICVFCGSNSGASPAYAAAARSLGRAIAAGGHDLVYGGGRVGLMGIVADAVLEGGGAVVGVMPGHLVEREVGHTGLTRLEVTPSMHARKARMAALTDGVVALPGGFGTLEEVIEILTWNQLGLVSIPVVFLDVGGFYDALFALFDAALEAGFVREAHRGLARRTSDPADAVALALTSPSGAPAVDKWLDLEAT